MPGGRRHTLWIAPETSGLGVEHSRPSCLQSGFICAGSRVSVHLDDLYGGQLSDRVVGQVGAAPTVQLVHAASIQHGL